MTNEAGPANSQAGRGLSQQKGTQPMITNNSQRMAEANLRLAADVEERTGWTVARLIAASVTAGAGQGARTSLPAAEKLSMDRAAKVMRKSNHTIKAYLAAWDAAAKDGLCKRSADLTPEDGQTTPLPDADWSEYYTNTKPRGVGITQVTDRAQDDPDYAQRLTEAIAPERTPGAALSEWASSPDQMRGILNSPTGAGDAARRFVREAIKSDPDAQREARKALDDVYEDAPKPYPSRPEPSVLDEAQDLVHEFRKLHKGIDSIVRLVNDGVARIADRDAALAEIRWLRTALSYIEDGIKSDNLTDEIADFLAEVSE